MQRTRSTPPGAPATGLDLGLRVEGQARLEAVLARAAATAAGGRRTTSKWTVTLSRAGLRERLEVLRRLVDHQVAVEHAARLVHERRDRLEHDRPDRHRLDEVPVADVEVEDRGARARAARRPARRAARSRPRRATARPRPSGSIRQPTVLRLRSEAAHPASMSSVSHQPRDEEPGRAVPVRQRQQELRPARVRELRPLLAERLDGSRPIASTTASFSSALSVQTE